MPSSRKDWIVQNRLWISDLSTAVVLALILIYVSVYCLSDIVVDWSQRLRSDHLSTVELQRELSTAKIQNQVFSQNLDSLLQMNDSDGSDQLVLSAIRRSCMAHSISLSGYDRLQSGASSTNKAASYRLSIHGKFHDMLMLVADLESSPLTLTVSSLALEKEVAESDRINGTLIVSSEA